MSSIRNDRTTAVIIDSVIEQLTKLSSQFHSVEKSADHLVDGLREIQNNSEKIVEVRQMMNDAINKLEKVKDQMDAITDFKVAMAVATTAIQTKQGEILAAVHQNTQSATIAHNSQQAKLDIIADKGDEIGETNVKILSGVIPVSKLAKYITKPIMIVVGIAAIAAVLKEMYDLIVWIF